VHWKDDDPGLPIEFGPCSNGEYDPEPVLPPVLRETVRRARALCATTADRIGMSRREFLLSACGAAATMLALEACTRESHPSSSGTSAPGGSLAVSPSATVEPSVAADELDWDAFVFDIQGHLLEYHLNPVLNGQDFWQAFPQQDCGEDDPRVCYSIEHFLELMFLRSDTKKLVLSALPIFPEGSPESAEIMDVTRRTQLALCRDARILLHGQALPNVGTLPAALDAMEVTARTYPIVAWKTFTHFPAAFEHDGNGWYLDDRDRPDRPIAEPFIRKALELGLPTICIHKGLSLGSPFASPDDVGPAARRHPDVNFVAYHSGFEAGTAEVAYRPDTRHLGTNRLLWSMERAGIGPNDNVYAEIGSSWWYVMRYPDQAAHFLGKLLRYVGEDNVLWGTDCLFYGSPQPMIRMLKAFTISAEYQDRYGYPELTREVKSKILGLNAARLYDVDPTDVACEFTIDELERIRRQLPGRNGALGPRSIAQTRAFREDDCEQWATMARMLA
jgi:predicted TIM-barrel fold metal-dependent hydrolase